MKSIFLSAVTAIVIACTEVSAETPHFDRSAMGGIKSMKSLSTKGMSVVSTETGQLYVLSANGRFAVVGGLLIDTWNNKKIESTEDFPFIDTIPVKRMRSTGLKPETFSSFRYGEGVSHYTIFATTSDKWSKATLKQLPALKDRFTFDVVLVPTTVEEANRIAGILCEERSDDSRLNAILKGDFVTRNDHQCLVGKLRKTAVAVDLLGIKRTPTIVADNGQVLIGTPDGMVEFLENNQ